jgi:hypothetical protein
MKTQTISTVIALASSLQLVSAVRPNAYSTPPHLTDILPRVGLMLLLSLALLIQIITATVSNPAASTGAHLALDHSAAMDHSHSRDSPVQALSVAL